MVGKRAADTKPTRTPTVRDLLDHTTGHAAMLRQRLFTRRASHDSVSWSEAVSDLGKIFDSDAEKILSETTLVDVEDRTRRLLAEIRDEDPFLNRWASDSLLARCCYLICRLSKPQVVVETGVAYGVSSAFILAALRENGAGELYSVDLLPLRRRAGSFQGIAVPREERKNWTLYHGPSRRILPTLMSELGGVDFFLHDSLHTAANMRFEFDFALRYLRPGGVLLADDVERNGTFSELRRVTNGYSTVVSDRETEPLHGRAAPAVFGIAIPRPLV